MKIRQGDKVIVVSGKDRGKIGKVVRAMPKEDRVVVEGVNIIKKHQRSRKKNEKGQILEKAMPIHVSNVQVVDPKSDKPTRVVYKIDGKKKTRTTTHSGTAL